MKHISTENVKQWVSENGLDTVGSKTITSFCDDMKISRQTFYNLIKTKEFKNAITAGNEVFLERQKVNALQALKDGLKKRTIIQKKTEYTNNGSGDPVMLKQTITETEVLPDMRAVLFVLGFNGMKTEQTINEQNIQIVVSKEERGELIKLLNNFGS